MKAFLFIISILTFSFSNATTYYISSSTGLDSRTGLQAQNANTPWQTLAKVNAFTFSAGDSILFKRNDTFFGGIAITQSGNSANPIVFGAYGTGEKPIITGFTAVNNWTLATGNIYEYYNGSYPSHVNMVVVDGSFQAMGRYPKSNANNHGWLTNQSHVGHTSLSSNEIANLPSFVGGEIVMKKYQWLLDKGKITDQTATTINLDHYVAPAHPSVFYDIMDNHGFFFQNHINTLTQPKEWCYDDVAKKIKMYSPGSSIVQVSTIENLVNLNAQNFVNFDNISFTGANSFAFNITNGSGNISITNCNIAFTGINAINVDSYLTSKITIDGCNISYTNNNAIQAGSTNNWLIQNNTITNTGMIEGMGASGDGQYNAISYTSDNSIIQYNKIIKTGYIGIHFTGNNTTIKNNYLDSFVMIKSDGGGIYAYGETTKTNRLVTGNIILNGPGNLYGVAIGADSLNPYAGQVHGIYMDGGTGNVTLSNNTVANCAHSGIWLSSPKSITAYGNTLYNNTVAQIKVAENVGQISDLTLKQNVILATDSAKLVGSFILNGSSLSTIGNIDSNYYGRPLYEPQSINTNGYPNGATYFNYPAGGIIEATDFRYYSLDSWKSLSNQDSHTIKSPLNIDNLNKIRFLYNTDRVNKTIILDATYVDLKNIVYTNSVMLKPFTSLILIRSGSAPINQTISFDTISNKVYGDPVFNINATASSKLPVSFKIVSGPANVSGNTITITGTGTVAVSASQDGNASYNPAPPVTQSFNITASKICKPTFVNDNTIVLDASCGHNDGNVSIIPTSGVPPFMYSKDGGVTYVAGPNTGSGFMNLAAGTYKLRLKDANGCESDIVEKIVKSLNCPTSTCTPPQFLNDGTIVLDATCGNNDGNISIIPTSGVAPFMYSKDGGITYVSGPNTGSGFMKLAAGTYKLRLKDANGCESAIVERTVKSINCPGSAVPVSPSSPVSPALPVTPSSTSSATVICTPPQFLNDGTIVLNATCGNNDGNISIIPTSGVAPFMYSKDGGITYVSGSNTGSGFMNLAAGTYKLRLKDANGCESAIVERTVKSINCPVSAAPVSPSSPVSPAPPVTPALPVAPSSTSSATVICTPPQFLNDGTIVLDATCGNNDGNISIIPTSGVAPFMYSKDGGITYVSGPNTGSGFMKLAAGTYKLRLKDANGCESAIIERTVKSINCPVSAAPVSPSSPVSPALPVSPAPPVTPALPVTPSSTSSPTVICTPPQFLNDGTIVLDATCGNNDGNISIIPTSGVAPFMYSKDGGITYVSGPNSGSGFMKLAAGTYKLRLKDANGCESAIVERTVKSINCPVSAAPVSPSSPVSPAPPVTPALPGTPSSTSSATVICTPPQFLNNNSIILDASCANNDGNISIIPTSGTAPFMYSKDGGTTYVSGSNSGSGFMKLAAGTYKLRLKDAMGCESEIVEKTIKIVYGYPCTQVPVTPIASALAATVPMPPVAIEGELVKAYPNPSRGQFKVQLLNFKKGVAEVSIVDGKGSIIKKSQINVADNNTIDFNLTGQTPGMYYVKITGTTSTKTYKILIQ